MVSEGSLTEEQGVSEAELLKLEFTEIGKSEAPVVEKTSVQVLPPETVHRIFHGWSVVLAEGKERIAVYDGRAQRLEGLLTDSSTIMDWKKLSEPGYGLSEPLYSYADRVKKLYIAPSMFDLGEAGTTRSIEACPESLHIFLKQYIQKKKEHKSHEWARIPEENVSVSLSGLNKASIITTDRYVVVRNPTGDMIIYEASSPDGRPRHARNWERHIVIEQITEHLPPQIQEDLGVLTDPNAQNLAETPNYRIVGYKDKVVFF